MDAEACVSQFGNCDTVEDCCDPEEEIPVLSEKICAGDPGICIFQPTAFCVQENGSCIDASDCCDPEDPSMMKSCDGDPDFTICTFSPIDDDDCIPVNNGDCDTADDCCDPDDPSSLMKTCSGGICFFFPL